MVNVYSINGKSELYINKGEYTIMADFGDYSITVNINITCSGEYDITFFKDRC